MSKFYYFMVELKSKKKKAARNLKLHKNIPRRLVNLWRLKKYLSLCHITVILSLGH